MAKLILTLVSLFAIVMMADSQLLGGLFAGLSGGGSGGAGASVNVSTTSAFDNRTITLFRAILTTPFTKAGFFQKLSLLSRLSGGGSGGGFGFNKNFLFGGNDGAGAVSTTTPVPTSTPFPDVVYKPASVDDDEEDNKIKVSAAGSVSVGSKGVVATLPATDEDESDKDSESSDNLLRFSDNGSDKSVSKNSKSESGIKVTTSRPPLIRVQSALNARSGGGRVAGSGSLSASSSSSSTFSSPRRGNGYQYFPAGPDRLTIPTDFESNRNRVSNSEEKRSVTEQPKQFRTVINISENPNQSNQRLRGKPFSSGQTGGNNGNNASRKLSTNENTNQPIQPSDDLTSPEEINNLKDFGSN